jgi:hypothetical protein
LRESDSPYNAIPLSTDTHGFIYQPAPRFGPDACKWDASEAAQQLAVNEKVTYPFEGPYGGFFDKQKTGTRTFDYNYDGLAHVGLLPDFIEDLKNVGVTDEQLEPLFNSAEAYIRMWQRVEQASIGNLPPVADAGVDQSLSTAGADTADVTLNGSGSSDPNGDTLTYAWTLEGASIASGVNPSIELAPGTHVIGLVVSDGVLESGTDAVVITVEGPPGVPQNLLARAKYYHVNVVWSAVGGAEFCRVYRRLDSETDFSIQGTTATSVFVDDLPDGTLAAEYFVVAVNGAGESNASDIVAVEPTQRRRRR